MLNGKPAVRVELFGRIAERLPEGSRYVTLDAEDWPRVNAMSEWWGLVGSGGGRLFAGRGTSNLAAVANQAPGSHPNAVLSRLILKAEPGQVVMSMSGNPLDLRKANLHLADDRAAEGEVRATARSFLRNLEGVVS